MVTNMKKIILIIGIIMSIILVINKKEEIILIPNEAIRVRVIANSYNKEDIKIKEELKDMLNSELNLLLDGINNINDVRTTINNNLDFINSFVDKSLKELNLNTSFTLNYGKNYFPKKEFNGVIYDDGLYESLVITLGEGKGPNYWCVLYPPICSIENEKGNNFEYKFYIKEIIDKYL